jgi:hypothetical protein
MYQPNKDFRGLCINRIRTSVVFTAASDWGIIMEVAAAFSFVTQNSSLFLSAFLFSSASCQKHGNKHKMANGRNTRWRTAVTQLYWTSYKIRLTCKLGIFSWSTLYFYKLDRIGLINGNIKIPSIKA